MENFSIISILIVFLLVVGLFVAYFASKKTREEISKTGKYPKGHFMGQGMGIGMAIGVAIGVALDNIALGPAIGVAFGVAIGTSMEKKHKDEIRPMTDGEMRTKRNALLIIFLLGLVAFVAFTAMYYFAK